MPGFHMNAVLILNAMGGFARTINAL